MSKIAGLLASTSMLRALALAATLAAPQAYAETCAEWMTKLVAERNAALIEAHQSGDWFWGHPGSPADFCPKADRLNATSEALLAFMVKNKAQCSFPDGAIAQLAGHVKHNKDFANWYCKSR